MPFYFQCPLPRILFRISNMMESMQNRWFIAYMGSNLPLMTII